MLFRSKHNSERTTVAFVATVPSKETRALLILMTEGAGQETPVTGETEVCHGAAVAEVAVVEGAAGVDEKLSGTTQSIF